MKKVLGFVIVFILVLGVNMLQRGLSIDDIADMLDYDDETASEPAMGNEDFESDSEYANPTIVKDTVYSNDDMTIKTVSTETFMDGEIGEAFDYDWINDDVLTSEVYWVIWVEVYNNSGNTLDVVFNVTENAAKGSFDYEQVIHNYQTKAMSIDREYHLNYGDELFEYKTHRLFPIVISHKVSNGMLKVDMAEDIINNMDSLKVTAIVYENAYSTEYYDFVIKFK